LYTILLFVLISTLICSSCSKKENKPDQVVNKIIDFSNYQWSVRNNESREPPNGNLFSQKNVNLDSRNRLHLLLTKDQGKWKSAQVYNTQSLGYGKYTFHIEAPLDKLDANVVMAFFVYEKNKENNELTEIDIEFAKWGNEERFNNSQYVIQRVKFGSEKFVSDYKTSLIDNKSTHIMEWKRHYVRFTSLQGNTEDRSKTSSIIKDVTFKGEDIPVPHREVASFSLWTYKRKGPLNQKPVEIIVDNFKFIPL